MAVDNIARALAAKAMAGGGAGSVTPEDLEKKYDKTGGAITGDVAIQGNLTVSSPPSALNQVARVSEVGEVVSITAPAGATNGTLTAAQLQVINRNICSLNGGINNNTWILFNKERYYPMSYEHQAGYRTYANVEYEDNNLTVKAITVNLKTGAWTLDTWTEPRVYKHVITAGSLGFSIIDYSAIPTPYTSDMMLNTYELVCGYYNAGGSIGPIVSPVSVDYNPSVPGIEFTFQYLSINSGSYINRRGSKVVAESEVTDTVTLI